MPTDISNPFKIVLGSNSLIQCDDCGYVASFDVLDLIVETNRICHCGGELQLFSPAINIPLSGETQ